MTQTASRPSAPSGGKGDYGPPPKRRRRNTRLRGTDRLTVGLFVIVPTVLVVGMVWIPALMSIALSFFNWDGLGSFDQAEFIGLKNYEDATQIYPPFWPALQHNIIWLVVLFIGPTVLGILLAVVLDRELRGSRLYQSAFFLPTVLSLALIGFIWQLIYSRDQGLINAITGGSTDWYGDSSVNLWAVLVAAGWRHTGYIMLLYLAGLKGVDPSLREAALMDGCNERQTFFRVVFPVMRPINILILVITMIESLRAFDLVWVVNKGRNGLELIGALVLQNLIGEASRVGFGSALATMMLLISSVMVVIYLKIVLKEEDQ